MEISPESDLLKDFKGSNQLETNLHDNYVSKEATPDGERFDNWRQKLILPCIQQYCTLVTFLYASDRRQYLTQHVEAASNVFCTPPKVNDFVKKNILF